jgi:hypothetical protein
MALGYSDIFNTPVFLLQILETLIMHANCSHFWHKLHKSETALTCSDTQTRVWYISAVI